MSMSVNQLTFAALLGLACFGSGAATAQSAQGQLNLGASHSSRYGSAVDLSFRGTDLGGYGINAFVAAKNGGEGRQLSFNVERQIALDDTRLGRDTQLYLGILGKSSAWEVDAFDSKNIGLEVSYDAEIRPNLRYSAGLFWQRDTLEDFAAGTSAFLVADEGTTDAAGAYLGLIWDTYLEDGPLAIGADAGVQLRVAGLGGGRDFKSVTAFAHTTRPLVRDAVLRLEVQGGAINSSDGVHLIDRAFSPAGGLRGFTYAGITPRDSATGDALGGTKYVSASVEALAPYGTRGIAVGAFADVGSVWSLADIVSPLVDDKFELRSSAGLTLKWKTASSYLGISLAAPVEYLESDDKKTFSISFGSEF